jgi:hypothetical protein
MSPLNEMGIFTIYDRFGNLFPLYCKVGKLYRKTLPSSNENDEKTIFFEGNYFTYEYEEGSLEVQPTPEIIKRIVGNQFVLKLKKTGYIINKKYIVYSKDNEVKHPHKDIFSIFDGFEYRVVIINNQLLLCINPHLTIKTNCTIKYLIDAGINPDKLKDFSVRYKRKEGGRIDGYLVETVVERECFLCKIKNYREFKEEILPADSVFPEPKPELIQHFLLLLGRNFDLIEKQRELSFLNSKTASKDRFYKTLEIVNSLKKSVFPLNFGDWKVDLEITPIVVKL